MKSTCPQRTVVCQYCNLPRLAADIEAHSAVCGARTEKCELCSKWIALKDWKLHQDSACTLPAAPLPAPPPLSSMSRKKAAAAAHAPSQSQVGLTSL